MRRAIEGLPTAQPLAETLPGVLADDDFTRRLCAALDEVLAPVLLVLDNMVGYLDPRLVPEDMLDWLAGWVAWPLDEHFGPAQRRELIAHAVQLHRLRGTVTGLRQHIALLTGGSVEITDSGGCTWSADSSDLAADDSPPRLDILVRVSATASVDLDRLRNTVAQTVPAHVPFTIKVTAIGRAQVPTDNADE